jgi:hypothetical protein
MFHKSTTLGRDATWGDLLVCTAVSHVQFPGLQYMNKNAALSGQELKQEQGLALRNKLRHSSLYLASVGRGNTAMICLTDSNALFLVVIFSFKMLFVSLVPC